MNRSIARRSYTLDAFAGATAIAVGLFGNDWLFAAAMIVFLIAASTDWIDGW